MWLVCRITCLLALQAVLVGERVTGSGVVQALGHPTGVSLVRCGMHLSCGISAAAQCIWCT